MSRRTATSFGHLRQLLGEEYDYVPGQWFWVPHDDLRRADDGSLFSSKTGPDGRPVVLARREGPNTTGFARSTSRKTRFEHVEHEHDDDPDCVTAKKRAKENRGWLAYNVPIALSDEVLENSKIGCKEPDCDGFLAKLRQLGAM